MILGICDFYGKGVKGLDASIAEHWTPLQWWHQRNESPWSWEFATFTVRCHECQGTRCQYCRPLATFGMEVLREWQLISDHRAYIWPLLLLLGFFCFRCPSSLWHSYTSYRCKLSHHSHCTTQSHLTVQSQFSLHEPKPSDCAKTAFSLHDPKPSDCAKSPFSLHDPKPPDCAKSPFSLHDPKLSECAVTILTARPKATWMRKGTILTTQPKAVWL